MRETESWEREKKGETNLCGNPNCEVRKEKQRNKLKQEMAVNVADANAVYGARGR
jgi:hypothetical protein